MKTVFNIKDVFDAIKSSNQQNENKIFITVDGTKIKVTKNLLRLARKGINEMQCCVCGCIGTHIQRYEEEHKKHIEVMHRVMCWNSKYQKQSYLNLDHIIVASKGGTWNQSNLRVTCYECNNERGNADIIFENQFSSKTSTEQFVKMKNVLPILKKHSKVNILPNHETSLKHRLSNRLGSFSFKRIDFEVFVQVCKDLNKKYNLQLSDLFYQEIETKIYIG